MVWWSGGVNRHLKKTTRATGSHRRHSCGSRGCCLRMRVANLVTSTIPSQAIQQIHSCFGRVHSSSFFVIDFGACFAMFFFLWPLCELFSFVLWILFNNFGSFTHRQWSSCRHYSWLKRKHKKVWKKGLYKPLILAWSKECRDSSKSELSFLHIHMHIYMLMRIISFAWISVDNRSHCVSSIDLL